jgi:hypothetical protein
MSAVLCPDPDADPTRIAQPGCKARTKAVAGPSSCRGYQPDAAPAGRRVSMWPRLVQSVP